MGWPCCLLPGTGLEVVEQAGTDAAGLAVVEADVRVGPGVGRSEGGGESIDAEQLVPEEGAIDGKLVNRNYTDKNGVKKYVTEVHANELLILTKKG